MKSIKILRLAPHPLSKKRQIKKSQLLSKQNILKILARDIPIILAHGYFEMSTKYKFIRKSLAKLSHMKIFESL